MKHKTKIFLFGGLTLIAVGFSIPKVAEAINLTSSENEFQNNSSKENLAIRIALQDFSSLEEFDNYFLDYDSNGNTSLKSDDNFLIPDTLGNNGTNEQHGWSEFPSEREADDVSVYDESTGHTTYQSKSDGATVKEIREALVERGDTK